MKTLAALALACALAPGCSSEKPLDVPDGCQPLEGDLSCALPYPSNFFLSGGVVTLTGAGKPTSASGVDADGVTPLAADGFSREPGIVCALPDTVVADGLPNIEDEATRSTDASRSPTLILDADTGETLAHYVDVDPNADDATHVAISIHPLVQLTAGHRYVVALFGVKNARGSLAAPAEGFRRIRDEDTALDPSLAPIAARFTNDVFAPLAKLGVARKSLQLAWDFTTGTQAWADHDMRDLQTLVQAWLAQNPSPVVTITDVEPDSAEYFRIIDGTVTVPLFLNVPQTGGVLFRGADGKIAQNGTTEVPFRAVVPRTVTEQWGAARALAFGHGFFGSVDEMLQQPARTLLASLGVVAFGVDWWGMSKDDLGTVIGLITNAPSTLPTFVERVYQAMANWMVMTRAMKTSLAKEPALHRPLVGDGTIVRADGTTNGGTLLYDPGAVYYFGASMGSILGSVMSSLNPDVERAVLNVGGASWEQMMPRASPFAGFNFFIKTTMGSELGAQTIEAMLASALDRIDPATYAPYLVGKPVIMQAGVGDAEVPNAATFFQARLLGLSMIEPTPTVAYGVPLHAASGLDSALTLWDFGISPDVYRVASPPADNAVHNGLRDVPTAITQMNAFLRNGGTVVDPCPAVCVGN
ncbi:MAG TPA: hypothetical protein VGH28_21130 [Polyangiaceae bacterium]|jgi:hypothetical protein